MLQKMKKSEFALHPLPNFDKICMTRLRSWSCGIKKGIVKLSKSREVSSGRAAEEPGRSLRREGEEEVRGEPDELHARLPVLLRLLG